MMPRYSLIFPNMFGFKGGIQVYSANLLTALQKINANAEYDVFLKYDKPENVKSTFLTQTQFYCFGNFPRWLQNLLLTLTILLTGLLKRPDLVISTHINFSLIPLCLKQTLGIPYWVIAHGLEVWDLQNPLLKLALSQADRVVAVSQYTRSRLLSEQNLSPERVVILPNTFDPDQFQIRPKPEYLLKRYHLQPEDPVILTVTRLGRSSRYKGYGNILAALVKVRQQLPNVRYLLVGKGDDRPWIEAQIEQFGLADCVNLTGFVPDTELAAYYQLCDVFALPSQGEGFGIVYLEALACGKSVLAGNQDGAVDPLDQGRLGCLVDPEDIDAIALNLTQILQQTYPNPLLYQPQVLREEAIKNYRFDQFIQILAHLLEGHSTSSEFSAQNNSFKET